MDVGVFAPAVVGKLLLSQKGQQLVNKFRLRRGLDHSDGVSVEPIHGGLPLGAEVAPAEDFKDAVSHMGKAQIGDGVNLLFR